MLFKWLKEETKYKTEFGNFLEMYDIKKEWLARKSKISQSLISLLIWDHSRTPKPTTANKIIKVLREFEPNIKMKDLW
jgi:hypothetical protein